MLDCTIYFGFLLVKQHTQDQLIYMLNLKTTLFLKVKKNPAKLINMLNLSPTNGINT